MEINRTAYQQPTAVSREQISAPQVLSTKTTQVSRDLPVSSAAVDAPGTVPDAQLEDAVKAANKLLAPGNNSIQFSIDDDSGKTIVKLVDSQTNEVIRQFPSQQMLAIAKDLTQSKGVLISEKS